MLGQIRLYAHNQPKVRLDVMAFRPFASGMRANESATSSAKLTYGYGSKLIRPGYGPQDELFFLDFFGGKTQVILQRLLIGTARSA